MSETIKCPNCNAGIHVDIETDVSYDLTVLGCDAAAIPDDEITETKGLKKLNVVYPYAKGEK